VPPITVSEPIHGWPHRGITFVDEEAGMTETIAASRRLAPLPLSRTTTGRPDTLRSCASRRRGAIGWGEAVTGAEDASIASGDRDGAPRLLGRDPATWSHLGRAPRDHLLVWQRRHRHVRDQRHRHGDVDLAGRLAGLRCTPCSAASAATASARHRRSSSTRRISTRHRAPVRRPPGTRLRGAQGGWGTTCRSHSVETEAGHRDRARTIRSRG
jgi:hypothetical protein